jgi:flagellar motor switch protein FliM
MNLCFPTFALEPILAKLNMQNVGSLAGVRRDVEWMNTIKRQVGKTSTDLVGVLGSTQLTLRDLLALKLGDVVKTSITEGSDAQILIGNKTRLWGRAGVHNGRLAIKVTHTIAEK